MHHSDVGLIGLAVMGQNLALNIEGKGFSVSLYNRSHPDEEDIVARFLAERGKGRHFAGNSTPQEFVASIDRPRKILLMIKAGPPVDEVIHQLLPYLEEGDVIIDGGNSDFHDTSRRVEELRKNRILFVGAGISGGEKGALYGPSIMPGGSAEAWPVVKELLQAIAAKLENNTPCCQWIGKGGAGHYVKMVHNGIEYANMQLIAEVYDIIRKRLALGPDEIAGIFEKWNKGELNSYLLQITSDILRFKESENHYLLDSILDVAGQKGTGKWNVIAGLDEQEPLSLTTEAVFVRFLSMRTDERAKAAKLYETFCEPAPEDAASKLEALKKVLYATLIISHAQGFSLMRRASAHYGWQLDLPMIADIWREGCIIRSASLKMIAQAYRKNPELENLLFDEYFREHFRKALPLLRIAVAKCVLNAVAIPCTASALSYFDGLCTSHTPTNLIQAQRDYFGAHTYERVDAERGRFFHTDWTKGVTKS